MIKKIVLFFTLIISVKSVAQNAGTFCFEANIGGFSLPGTGLIQASDGNFYVGGTKGISTLNSDFYLCKISGSGTLLWSKKMGIPGNDGCGAICEADGGNIVLAGETANGLHLMKSDSSGNILSSYIYNNFDGEPKSIIRTADKGYAVTGTYYYAIFVCRFDSSMNPMWAAYTNGTVVDGNCIIQTNDGGFAVAGSFNGNTILIKLDSLGNSQWIKTAGGNTAEQGQAVIQTGSGDYILAGCSEVMSITHYNIYLVKFNSSGNLLWTRTYGSPTYEDVAYSLVKTFDGGYAIAGYYVPGAWQGILVMKFDSNDSLQWSTVTTTSLGGTAYPRIVQTIDHGFAATARTPLAPTISVIKIDSMGNGCCMVPVTLPSGTGGTSGNGGTMSFYSNPTVSSGGTDTVISISSSLMCVSTGITPLKKKENEIFIFPNPSAGNFSIDFGYLVGNGTLELYNIFRQKLFEQNIINESKKVIHLKSISAGIYFVKVFDGEKNYCKKVIVAHFNAPNEQ